MRATGFHFDELDIFRGLSADERDALASRFEYRSVPGGERLIEQGEEATRLHIVVSGRFAVSCDDGPTLAVIARGEPVGEIAFFNGGKRTADVTALRDSEVVSIDRADFEELADAQPILWHSTVLALTNRLVKATAHTIIDQATPSKPRTLVLCPAGDGKVSYDFAFALIDALSALGTTASLLDEETAANATGGVDINSPKMNRWLSVHETAHDLIIWFAPREATEWAQKAVRHADAAMLVGVSGPQTIGPIESLVAHRLDSADIRLAAAGGRISDWLAPRKVGGSHHARTEAEIFGLARFICGKARGLVLGGGGALCGAHVGVVFAMREAGFDFDSFAGTSAGAAIAGGLALGVDRSAIIERCEDIFLTNRALKRWTVPRFGLIDATVVDTMVQKHFGLGLIEDLLHPFLAIATDLSDNKMHVMERGPLWQAVRASCSIPVLLPPFIDDEGRILVDGGITDNLPVDPMRARKRGPNFAVMLGEARWRRAEYRYSDYPSRGALILEKMLPWRKPSFKAPRLGQVMTRSMLLSSDAASQEALTRSDAVFLPPLPKGMGITDWKRFTALERDTFEWAKREIDLRLTENPTEFDAFR